MNQDPILHAMQNNHREARSELNNLTQANRLMSILLIVVIVGSLAAIYRQVTTMYDPANFEQPLQDEARAILVRAQPELQKLWAETAPIYGEMALGKLEAALPEVQEASQRELDALRASLTGKAQDKIHDALRRISSKREKQLQAYLPTLSTVEGAEEMGTRWMVSIENDFEDILLRFTDRYTEDLGELAATLDQFRSAEFDEMPEDALMRHFAHLWLLKADRLVVLMDQDTRFEEDAYHVE
jgi:hypothetical protein